MTLDATVAFLFLWSKSDMSLQFLWTGLSSKQPADATAYNVL
jgi:hypothetical protein